MGTDAARSDPTCPGREPIWTTAAIAADAFKATYHNGSKGSGVSQKHSGWSYTSKSTQNQEIGTDLIRDRWPLCLNGLPSHQTRLRIVDASTAAFNENYYILHHLFCKDSSPWIGRSIPRSVKEKKRRGQVGGRAWLIYVIIHSLSFFTSCDYGGVWEFLLGNILKI